MRVLVVDDSAAVSARLIALLRERGITADVARNLEGARTLLEISPPDVVVLDLRIEGGSGLDLIDDVRARAPHATVIVLTNETSPAHRHACSRRGVRHFFDKSRDFERAIELVAAQRATPDGPPR